MSVSCCSCPHVSQPEGLRQGGRQQGSRGDWAADAADVSQWTNSPGLTDAGLQPLTALKRLQELSMHGNDNLSEELVSKDEFCTMLEEL